MDEISTIDIIEKIKNSILLHKPELEIFFNEKRNESYLGKDAFYFKSKLLATALKINDSLPSGVRKIRRIIAENQQLLEENTLESAETLMVKEDKVSVYTTLPETPQEAIAKSLNKIDLLNEENKSFDSFFRSFSSLEPLVKFLTKEIPLLKGLLPYRFLKAINYNVIIPDAPRQQILFRLGLLDKEGSASKIIQKQFEVIETISRLTGESVNNIDYMFGVYSGAEKVQGFEPICIKNPHCESCTINNYCTFFKFRNKTTPIKKYTLKELDEQDRPREKMERIGPQRLSDAELLALFIRTGVGNETAIDLAHKILYAFGDLQGIDNASIAEICQIHGIGKAKAIEIKAAFEIGKRFATIPIKDLTQIAGSRDVYEHFKLRFTNVMREVFVVLMLDSKHRIFKEEIISEGSLSSSLVHPREVFKAAIKESAAAVIFVHNHPSGDPAPSVDDITTTTRLQNAGNTIGIKTIDHIIIGNGAYFSFRDEELIK